MSSYFVVKNTEGLWVDCLYYGSKKENAVRRLRHLKQGDHIKIKNQGKFIIGIGWYILILLNNEEKVFVFLKDLENAIETKHIQTLLDLELEQCYLGFLVDSALDTRNKELFMKVSKKYIELMSLKKKNRVPFTI